MAMAVCNGLWRPIWAADPAIRLITALNSLFGGLWWDSADEGRGWCCRRAGVGRRYQIFELSLSLFLPLSSSPSLSSLALCGECSASLLMASMKESPAGLCLSIWIDHGAQCCDGVLAFHARLSFSCFGCRDLAFQCSPLLRVVTTMLRRSVFPLSCIAQSSFCLSLVSSSCVCPRILQLVHVALSLALPLSSLFRWPSSDPKHELPPLSVCCSFRIDETTTWE